MTKEDAGIFELLDDETDYDRETTVRTYSPYKEDNQQRSTTRSTASMMRKAKC